MKNKIKVTNIKNPNKSQNAINRTKSFLEFMFIKKTFKRTPSFIIQTNMIEV